MNRWCPGRLPNKDVQSGSGSRFHGSPLPGELETWLEHTSGIHVFLVEDP